MRKDGRTWFGHTGGAPGGITGAYSDRESGLTAVVLMNNSVAKDPEGSAIRFGEEVAATTPRRSTPWTPGPTVPAELLPLVGVWFSEGSAFVFRIREGRLEAVVGGADPDDPAVGVRGRRGRTRSGPSSGRERGERLAGAPPRGRLDPSAELGDLPLHPRAARLRRARGVTQGSPGLSARG